MAMEKPSKNLGMMGRKIFFLSPSTVVQNKIIPELFQQEYEVYVSKDRDAVKRVFRKYPDSILFIDIAEQYKENDWENWIKAVMKAGDTKNISIGIVTAMDDKSVKEKYLNTIKVSCGYTVLKFDLDKAISQLILILQTADAKGRRKFIRAVTLKETNATLNVPFKGMYIKGQIKDISVAGFSCSLEDNPEILKNTLLKDIQLKLQSSLIKVEGVVFGSRSENNENIYVILFTQRIDVETKIKIRNFIHVIMQNKMDSELK